jgi:hypothetical protein
MNSDQKSNILFELKRIEEDCEHTAKALYNSAARSSFWQNTLSILAAVMAGIAGFSAIKDRFPLLTIIAAFLAAIISTILTSAKLGEKAANYHQFGVSFQKLRDDSRIFRTIQMLSEITIEDAQRILCSYSERRSKLRADAPQPSGWAFRVAKKGIDEGEAIYKVDK